MTDRTWTEIVARLSVIGFGEPIDPSYQQILQAMQFAYNAPAGTLLNIRQSWNNWLDLNITENVVVEFASLQIDSIIDGGKIFIDPSIVSALIYLSPTGKAVSDTLYEAVMHELTHAVAGYSDNDSINSAGDVVLKLNTVLSQVGIEQSAHYWGSSTNAHTLLIAGKEYTGGQAIDIAIVLNPELNDFDFGGTNLVNTETNGGLRDLIIGGLENDTLLSGGGNDFLYGGLGDGQDTLNGGAGQDKLYGENGDDLLIGGSDIDNLVGGEGNDRLIGHTATVVSNGNYDPATVAGDDQRDTLDGGAGIDTYIVDSVFWTPTLTIDNLIPQLDHIGDLDGGGKIQLFDGILDINWVSNGAGYVDALGGSDYYLIQSGSFLVFTLGNNIGGRYGKSSAYFTVDAAAPNQRIGIENLSTTGFATASFAAGSDGRFLGMTFLELLNQIAGTTVTESIVGTAARDYIQGFAGDDTIDGGSDDDFIQGGDGNDSLTGGLGVDTLSGGAGNKHILRQEHG